MKQNYIKPEYEIICFENEDILAVSSGNTQGACALYEKDSFIGDINQ